jgi:opacity protein-like surface antigen
MLESIDVRQHFYAARGWFLRAVPIPLWGECSRPCCSILERSVSMKKSLIPLLLATATILLPAAPCAAEPVGVYVAPRFTTGTVNFRHVDWDNNSSSATASTSGGALAVGYDFRPTLKVPVRVEVEYSTLGKVKKSKTERTYHQWDYKSKVTVGTSALFANAYFDWHNGTAFTPYVNLGLGTSFLSVKGKTVDPKDGYAYTNSRKTSVHSALNIGLGSAWRLSETISLDLGYRYARLGDKAKSKTDEDGDDLKVEDVETHQFILGARFLF